MIHPTAADVRATIVAHVAAGLNGAPADVGELSDDVDLLEAGLVDSFGLLELIGELERRYGVVLGFEDVGLDELTQLGPLSRYVAAAPRSDGPEAFAPEPALAAPNAPITSPSPPSSAPLRRTRRLLGSGAAATHRLWVRARDKAFSLAVGGSFAAFGRHSVVQMPVRLAGERAVAVGSDVFVGAGSWIQVLGDPAGIVIEIGDGTAMAGYCVLSAASGIRIGRDVSFARGVYVSDVAHEYDDPSRPILEQGTTDARPIEIGDGAWLGENVTVLPGVRIGKGAVVSANSVVARDVPDYTLVAGAPARVLRRFAG